jgi:hypothetical protein
VTVRDRSLLLGYRDRVLEIESVDGEVLIGDVVFVSAGTEEVVYDMLETNRPDRYPDKWIGFEVFALPFDQIAAFRIARSTSSGSGSTGH